MSLCLLSLTLSSLAEDSSTADPYSDYWLVYVHYCSSDFWSGTASASEATAGYNFLGRHIVGAVVQDLSDNYNLLAATTVVLTGCSAGAAGVALNCDEVASKVPDADFRCVAGFLKNSSFYAKHFCRRCS